MAANAYLREQLGVQTDQRYEILSMDVHQSWNWLQGESKGNSYTSTSGALARALRRNPHLQRGLQRAGFTGGWLDALPKQPTAPKDPREAAAAGEGG